MSKFPLERMCSRDPGGDSTPAARSICDDFAGYERTGVFRWHTGDLNLVVPIELFGVAASGVTRVERLP